MFIYLINRFTKFSLINKLSGNNAKKTKFFSACIVLLIVILSIIIFDSLNTAIIMIHLGIIWLICDAFSAIVTFSKNRLLKLNTTDATTKNCSLYCAGIAAITITAIYLCFGWYLAHHVSPTYYTVTTDKTVAPLRIVQFADSHIGTTFHADGFAKNIEKLQAANPDIVLITGDFVDDSTSKEDMLESCKALGTLNTKYGVYYSFGNHDKGYYGSEHRGYSGDDLIAELSKNNVIVLQDEIVELPNGYSIIGRQDKSEEQFSKRATMNELAALVDMNNFSIVLDHQPNDYANEKASKVDLVLSGHTHGGQLIPILYVGEWIGANDKTYGYEKQDDTNFIVTSGISDWAVKFKTGCKAEYVIVDITPTPQP